MAIKNLLAVFRGFDPLKAEMGSFRELGSSRDSSMQRGASLDVSYDERDMLKVRLHSGRAACAL